MSAYIGRSTQPLDWSLLGTWPEFREMAEAVKASAQNRTVPPVSCAQDSQPDAAPASTVPQQKPDESVQRAAFLLCSLKKA